MEKENIVKKWTEILKVEVEYVVRKRRNKLERKVGTQTKESNYVKKVEMESGERK